MTPTTDLTKTGIPTKYLVVDTKTGATVAICSGKQAARNKRDRLDAKYGAVRYAVRAA